MVRRACAMVLTVLVAAVATLAWAVAIHRVRSPDQGA